MRQVLALLVLGAAVQAQTVYQAPSATHPTIQSAINAAADGDTIQIGAGTFTENLVVVGKHLTIQGQGAGITIIDAAFGRAIELQPGLAGTTTVAFLDLINGTAQSAAVAPLRDIAIDPAYTLVLDHVRVMQMNGSAVTTDVGVSLEVRDSEFRMNAGSPAHQTLILTKDSTKFERVLIADNLAVPLMFPRPELMILSGGLNGSLELTDVIIRDNQVNRVLGATSINGTISLQRCRFTGNIGSPNLNLVSIISSTHTLISDCLFADNVVDGSSVLWMSGNLDLQRTTIAGNRSVSGSGSAIVFPLSNITGTTATLESSIIADNGVNSILIDISTSFVFRNCLLEQDVTRGTQGFGASVSKTELLIGLDAAFADVANGNFGLRPGSPAVDAGFSGAGTPSLDLNDQSRVVGAGIDMGCFEVQTLDPGASFAGTTSLNDVLTFNGSTGGTARSITVDAGTSCTIAVADPTLGSGAPFILWGYLGVPGSSDAFPIPFAGGSMAFLPHILGIGDPRLFTFTNNLLVPSSGILPSAAAPWSATGSCAPFPITMTLQGLIVDGGGPLRLTNALTLHTR